MSAPRVARGSSYKECGAPVSGERQYVFTCSLLFLRLVSRLQPTPLHWKMFCKLRWKETRTSRRRNQGLSRLLENGWSFVPSPCLTLNWATGEASGLGTGIEGARRTYLDAR